MSIEAIIAGYLADTGVAALVGTKVALTRLPQNTQPPAIVYRIVSQVPRLATDLRAPRAQARVQIDAIAIDAPDVTSIHAAVRAAMDLRFGETVAGKHVVSSQRVFAGMLDRDDAAGVWIQPVDYLIHWYE